MTATEPMLTDLDTPRVSRHGRLAEHAAADRSQPTLREVRFHVLELIRMEGPLLGSELNDLYRERFARYGWKRVSFDGPRKRAGEMLGTFLQNLDANDETQPALYGLTDAGFSLLKSVSK